MKTITLDITQQDKKEDIELFLKLNQLQRGDNLKIYTDESSSELQLSGIFMLIGFVVIYKIFNLNKTQNEILFEAISDKESLEEMEAVFEENLGVKIDIEPKPNASYDPLKDSFGLWKDENIDLDDIRTKVCVTNCTKASIK